MKSAAFQKSENQNKSMVMPSFNKDEDLSVSERHDNAFEMSSGPAFHFGHIKRYNPESTLRIQPKLQINEPGDQYEQEADAMADKVMRMSDKEVSQRSFKTSNTTVQRKCAECEKEDEEKKVQRKESNNSSQSFAQPIVQDVLNSSSGNPMDNTTRSFMESRFNHDFSDVKIHDNNKASESANSINALAYTSGNNIVFNVSQYNPYSIKGQKLLAHELMHVIQQGVKNRGMIQRDVAEIKESCPKNYSENEISKSRSEKGVIDEDVFMGGSGELVIADFGVDWRHYKKSLESNKLLREWIDIFETDTNYKLSIQGYSDCVGEKGNNDYLRSQRAKNIHTLLGKSASSRTAIVSQSNNYFASNVDMIGRAKNRCVIIKFINATSKSIQKPVPEPQPEDCSKYTKMTGDDVCEFYRCRERRSGNACGNSGYYLGYGYKYCKRFTELRKRMSEPGKRWIDKTRQCLWEHIDKNIDYHTPCELVKSAAFDSHPICYVLGGICFLSPDEWSMILNIIDSADNDLKQMVKTGIYCAGNYLPMAFPIHSLATHGGWGGLLKYPGQQ
ncbi:MAG: eCIS core domain-containing protein [Ginsengibacter sp.]